MNSRISVSSASAATLIGGWRHALRGQDPLGDRLLPALTGLLAAQQVGQPAGGDGDQPAERVVGTTLVRARWSRPR